MVGVDNDGIIAQDVAKFTVDCGLLKEITWEYFEYL